MDILSLLKKKWYIWGFKRNSKTDMLLPQNPHLPISALAGIFSNTTATYKFYWKNKITD